MPVGAWPYSALHGASSWRHGPAALSARASGAGEAGKHLGDDAEIRLLAAPLVSLNSRVAANAQRHEVLVRVWAVLGPWYDVVG